jgi:hypothetical protein
MELMTRIISSRLPRSLLRKILGSLRGISVGIGWLCGPISTLVPSGMVITRRSLFDMILSLLRLVMLYSFRFVLFSFSVGYNGEWPTAR